MKKLMPLFCILCSFAQPSLAANNITTLNMLSQAEFRILSEDMGSALSYKPITPAKPLGRTLFNVFTISSMSRGFGTNAIG